MIVLFFFAFISGLVTILAPCIWPLLPIVLSTSINGGKAKSLGITLGILLTFGLFNFAISYLVKIFGINPDVLRFLAVFVLLLLGIMMIVPAFARLFEGIVSKFAGKFGQTGTTHQGFAGGLITGAALGIVWTPCAGPILAAIATLAATAKVNASVVLVTLFYLTGVGVPLFAFSYGGQKLVKDTRFLSKYTGRIQQVFGIVLLLTASAIATNYDKVLQAKILDAIPSYSNFLTGFENSSAVKNQLDILKGSADQTSSGSNNILQLMGGSQTDGLGNYGPAPEFTGITKWLNPEQPLTMQSLRGNVVLIDFWTYTCINCIRTLPYVTSWYDKYKDKGFVVVGVHTPEFEFEKNTANVLDAIQRFKIHYPVAQDNNFATWNAYQNQYWPAEYLIDAKGIIRRTHFGEGEYDQTEMAIKKLLKEKGTQVDQQVVQLQDQTPQTKLTPETYLGTKRMERFSSPGASPQSAGKGIMVFSYPQTLDRDHFAFSGIWYLHPEFVETTSDSALKFNFYANKVFLVITPKNQNDVIKVYLDGKLVDNSNAGADIVNGQVKLDTQRLYNLIDLKGNYGNHTLLLDFRSNGIFLYAFTFG